MATQPASDWIEWKGGICPVDLDAMIEYRLRWFSGDTKPYRCEAKHCRWDHGRTPESADLSNPLRISDIVAYRVVLA